MRVALAVLVMLVFAIGGYLGIMFFTQPEQVERTQIPAPLAASVPETASVNPAKLESPEIEASTEPEGNPILVIEVAGSTSGTIEIELLRDIAPTHAERIAKLARQGAYDDVVFHRVIGGFMAQTGDVEFGKRDGEGLSYVGMGGSDMPDLPAEFSEEPYVKGVVGMARSQNPNSANSQFFIMFDDAPYLNGQYTVVGRVVAGQKVVDTIKQGDPNQNGKVSDPDYMRKVRIK